MIRSLIFDVPDRQLQALVTLHDTGEAELAFRITEGFHPSVWGPPIEPSSDSRPVIDVPADMADVLEGLL